MKLDDIAVDVTAEDEGQWFTWPEHPTVRIKVRSPHTPAYRKAQQATLRRLVKAYGKLDAVPLETDRSETAKDVVRHILVSVEGFTDDKDKPIPYSEDFGRMLLTDRRYRTFRDFVFESMIRVGQVEAEQQDADLGN